MRRTRPKQVPIYPDVVERVAIGEWHRVLCPRLETTEYALDCTACPYYRGSGGPLGLGYIRCAWFLRE